MGYSVTGKEKIVKRLDLEALAFWDGAVCLDCEGSVEEALSEAEDRVCSACGGGEVYSADLVLRCANFLDESEGDD